MKNNKAFTLSEILITLTIIGVIAAITIPTLMQKYTEHANVQKLKKTYNTLSNAFAQAIAENGTIDTWTSADNYNDRASVIIPIITSYIKAAKTCPSFDAKYLCFAQTYKKRSGVNANPVAWGARTSDSIVLSDGTVIKIVIGSGDGYPSQWCKMNIKDASRSSTNNYIQYCGVIDVDLNGSAGPNTDGVDFFVFKIFQDGILPSGRQSDVTWVEDFKLQCLPSTNNNASYGSCTAWAIMNGNMDYLRCNSLSWDGKKKCSGK